MLAIFFTSTTLLLVIYLIVMLLCDLRIAARQVWVTFWKWLKIKSFLFIYFKLNIRGWKRSTEIWIIYHVRISLHSRKRKKGKALAPLKSCSGKMTKKKYGNWRHKSWKRAYTFTLKAHLNSCFSFFSSSKTGQPNLMINVYPDVLISCLRPNT